ncbi:hypothetical protein OXX69_008405 [Metschnikowia pulcherrima]
MDTTLIHNLQDLLRFSKSDPTLLVDDASVLSCGCLVSESQFLKATVNVCPNCQHLNVSILKPVLPLRQLYRIVKDVKIDSIDVPSPKHGKIDSKSDHGHDSAQVSPQDSKISASRSAHAPKVPELDFIGLFCKYAKEEQAQSSTESAVSHVPSISRTEAANKPRTNSSVSSSTGKSTKSVTGTYKESGTVETGDGADEDKLYAVLSEKEERNFSQCFPFHRKITSFATQHSKHPFSSRALMKKISRFTGSAITTYFDKALSLEVTLFVLFTDKKWELYRHASMKPVLLACGKQTGEYGPDSGSLKYPADEGLVLNNDFADSKPESREKLDKSDLTQRLKTSVQLQCCLSEKYLVISGTKGMMRVLNVDPSSGDIGAPVYTYVIDFPIRCIALSPSNELIACGITTREKITGKQQPFVVLHHIEENKPQKSAENGKSRPVAVTPITITVPYRDPLKIMTFNASSSHLLCCTVYEMRYFVIRLRGDRSSDYRKPRLILSDTRLAKNPRVARGVGIEDRVENLDRLLGTEDDDQMLDNEGITDIKFGQPFSNTIVVTSSSLKDNPSVVLKVKGPAIDSRKLNRKPSLEEDIDQDTSPQSGFATSEDDDANTATDISVLMRLHDIGSNIYGVEVSPRGDSMVFVDKSGRLLLVATKGGPQGIDSSRPIANAIVLLGEVAPALRYTESASVCFSSDGGKVMAVDRKGVFQIFDFTQGVPGEDPEVIKCKIISVR